MGGLVSRLNTSHSNLSVIVVYTPKHTEEEKKTAKCKMGHVD